MNLPTPGVPTPVTSPTANIVDVLQNIESWGTVVMICLLVIAACSIFGVVVVMGELWDRAKRKAAERGRT